MQFRLRTLLIVVALAPPVLAGVLLMLMSPSIRPTLLDIIATATCIAGLRWLWIRWPDLVDSVLKR